MTKESKRVNFHTSDLQLTVEELTLVTQWINEAKKRRSDRLQNRLLEQSIQTEMNEDDA